jgi:hypothetical protein
MCWLTDQPWLSVTAPLTAGTLARSPETLERVAAQFDEASRAARRAVRRHSCRSLQREVFMAPSSHPTEVTTRRPAPPLDGAPLVGVWRERLQLGRMPCPSCCSSGPHDVDAGCFRCECGATFSVDESLDGSC